MQVKSFDANNNFDPNKLPNQTAISAVVFEDMSQIVFLMKMIRTEHILFTLLVDTLEKKAIMMEITG
jgi:hypothetical protein